MKSICVYCGSARLASQPYFTAARRMGATLAQAGLTLVYGGGRTGLMGALADSVLAEGGQVIGVITDSMNTPELAHTRLSRLEVTPTIHQRTAGAVAVIDSTVIATDSEKLRELCDEDHDLGYVVMRRMASVVASRLMVTRLQLLDMFAQPAEKKEDD